MPFAPIGSGGGKKGPAPAPAFAPIGSGHGPAPAPAFAPIGSGKPAPGAPAFAPTGHGTPAKAPAFAPSATPKPNTTLPGAGNHSSPLASFSQFGGLSSVADSPMNGHLGLPGTVGGGGGDLDVRKHAMPKAAAPPKAPSAPASPALNPSQFPNTPGTLTNQQVEQAWMQNAPNNLKDPTVAANMANIAQAESSKTPSTIQQGQPPGLTGYGMWQDTPTSGAAGGWNPKAPTDPSQNSFGNLLNLGNNVRMAANVLQTQGYHAFTDPVGLNLPSGPVTH